MFKILFKNSESPNHRKLVIAGCLNERGKKKYVSFITSTHPSDLLLSYWIVCRCYGQRGSDL